MTGKGGETVCPYVSHWAFRNGGCVLVLEINNVSVHSRSRHCSTVAVPSSGGLLLRGCASAGTGCWFCRLAWWSIALHECSFVSSSSKASLGARAWEAASLSCSCHYKVENFETLKLQLVCLRKQVVLWAVEFNGAVILPICVLRLTTALATHLSNPLCLFSFGVLYQLKKLWGTRAAYHPAAGKRNTKLLSSASLYFSADNYSRFSLTPSWRSGNF